MNSILIHETSRSERAPFNGGGARVKPRHSSIIWLSTLAFVSLAAHAAPVLRQTLNLHPGWNSVYLEVQPEANTPSEIFRDVPLDSVWTLKTPTLSVEFIQDSRQPVFNNAEWLRFIPTNRVESFQNTLFRIHAHRAYLIKVTSPAPVSLQLTGRPQVRDLSWKPDAFVLKGFPVDPAAPPSFATFFRGSKAHYDPILRRVQPIYRLNAAGGWVLADADDKIAPGEAYWVFTKGASDYPGPFAVRVPFGDTFDFTREVERQNLSLVDFTGSRLTVTLRDIIAPGANLLSYLNPNLADVPRYLPLPTPYSVTLAANEESSIGLVVRRQEMVGATYETILQATDGAGTRLLIPVTAGKLLGAAEAALLGSQGGSRLGLLSAGAVKLSPQQQAQSHAGLWSGIVKLDAVSEAHSADPNVTKPVATEFNLRLLLHVDTNGVTRLLKEVIQMVREGTYTNDNAGRLVRATPDRGVLVTDFAKLAQFKGGAMRDGQLIGRRLCSVGFDFAAANTNNFVLMSGAFGVGQTISGRLNVPATLPTNPFLHRYHPDHDNLAADFKQFKEEAYPVTRSIQLEFLPRTSQGSAADYGYNQISGNYRETLSGLHRRDLKVSGAFQLNRLTTIGILNE